MIEFECTEKPDGAAIAAFFEPAKRLETLEFELSGVPAARRADALAKMPSRQYEIVTPRTWRERLFSRPWRPWCPKLLKTGHGRIVRVDSGPDELTFEVAFVGPVETSFEPFWRTWAAAFGAWRLKRSGER